MVNAFAGCTKTSTAVMYAKARPEQRLLYLVLAAANAEEARQRFGANTTVLTTHQLAWRHTPQDVQQRVVKDWRPILLREQLQLRSNRLAFLTQKVLQKFWASVDEDVDDVHGEAVRAELNMHWNEVESAIGFAKEAWKRMNTSGDAIQLPHDAYLKMFALRKPKLGFHGIICDEWQDANPVTAQIVNAQHHANLLCLGDRHQSIFQFRGAINALEQFAQGASCFSLSQTWRFGPKVADLCNLILSEFKGERVPIKGMGQDGQWDESRYAYIARTNASLFRLAAQHQGEGMHWVGGPSRYRLDLFLDAYHLFSRNFSKVRDPVLRRFNSFSEYVDYAKDAKDVEAGLLVKLVEEYGHEIPTLKEQIEHNHVKDEKDASITMTTGHRAKGLEFDCVRIAEDFEVLGATEELLREDPFAKVDVPNLNLLYVVLSRARKSLALNADTTAWVDNLDDNRTLRHRALSRRGMHGMRAMPGYSEY